MHAPPLRRELDLRILQEALAREAVEEAADAAAKEAKRQEVRARCWHPSQCGLWWLLW